LSFSRTAITLCILSGSASPALAQDFTDLYVDNATDAFYERVFEASCEPVAPVRRVDVGGEWTEEDWAKVAEILQTEPARQLRSGIDEVVVQRMGLDLTPSGLVDGTYTEINISDLWFDGDWADVQDIVVYHELGHLWALNHLCAFHDFARIGWKTVDGEGRLHYRSIRREDARFPKRDFGDPDYASSSPQEDFAVSVEQYLTDPIAFAKQFPMRAWWLQQNVFNGTGCPTDHTCYGPFEEGKEGLKYEYDEDDLEDPVIHDYDDPVF
jgi:hypothetical protein